MYFIPKKTKYKKQNKGKLKNNVKGFFSLNNLLFGSIGLKALESGRISSSHFICCKQTINKIMKKKGQLSFSFFPHIPITKKPLEVRMGKGKGSVDHWVSNIFSGNVLMQIESSNKLLAYKALKTVQNKLPINTKIFFE